MWQTRTETWSTERFITHGAPQRMDRAVEQLLIEQYGLSNLHDKINSIAKINLIYEKAIQQAGEIMRAISFIK